MAREKSLQYELKQRALNNIRSTKTIRSYKHSIKHFKTWAKDHHISRFSKVDKDTIQQYTDDMICKGYSASTIHTRLAPICKACSISMNEISKPKRSSASILRSRTDWKNEQGQREATNSKHERLVSAQRVMGIRRDELRKLRVGDCIRQTEDGRYDWLRDESGYPCVHVRSGKGGKDQMQRVASEDLPVLMDVIKGASDIRPETRLFSSEEMRNKIDLHRLRGEHAREMYDRYAERLEREPGYRSQLREELIKRYDACNRDRKTAKAHRDLFVKNLYWDKPYFLRGDNKTIALSNDRPVVYDRTALMAVSVFHLSHWRLDVTVTNYMLERS